MDNGSQAGAMANIRSAALLVAGLLLGGCATVCPPPSITPRSSKPTATPHLMIQVPLAYANRLIAKQVGLMGPQAIPAPSLGLLTIPLPDLQVAVQRAQLLGAEIAGARLKVELELKHGQQLLLGMEVTARLRSVVEKGRVVLALRPADLESIKPRLEPRTREALASMLHTLVPEGMRGLITPLALESIAGALAVYLTSSGYDLLRKTLLDRLGELTRLSFAVPLIPLERAAMRTHTGAAPHLAVEIFSRLPVRRGVREHGAPRPGEISLLISGSLAAELGNWGMAQALLPRRYDAGFKPHPRGDRWPRYDWIVGAPRPLKIHITKTSSPCMQARVGARVELEVKGEHLAAEIRDGVVERVEGPALVKIGAWLRGLGAGPIEVSEKMVREAKFTIGGQTLAVQLKRGAVVDAGLALGVGVSLTNTPGPR